MKLSVAICKRLDAYGAVSHGLYNLAADIVDLAADEASGWTHRYDDAYRIPDVLREAADTVRLTAAIVEVTKGKSPHEENAT